MTYYILYLRLKCDKLQINKRKWPGPNLTFTLPFKYLGSVLFYLYFLNKYFILTKMFDLINQKYSKTVKYYHNFKQQFSISIYLFLTLNYWMVL